MFYKGVVKMDYLGEGGTFGHVIGGPRLFYDIYLAFPLLSFFSSCGIFRFKMFSLADASGRRTAAVALRNCLYLVPLGFVAYDCKL